MDLKIVGWVDFDSNYPTKQLSQEELRNVVNLVRNEIIEKGYLFSGEDHQNSRTGVPVFSDGTCLRASMRAWGALMAGIYEGPGGAQLSYIDFYMSVDGDTNLPEYIELDVLPATVEYEMVGLIIKEDQELINQSLSFGMGLMTTDKVLQKIYENNLL